MLTLFAGFRIDHLAVFQLIAGLAQQLDGFTQVGAHVLRIAANRVLEFFR